MSPRRVNPRIVLSSSQSAVRIPRKQIARLVDRVCREEAPVVELDVAFVDEEEIADANRRFLRHAGATDVISFDLSDDARRGLCVHLLVCGPVARRQAALHGEPVTREVLRYVAHGLLHQLGYDDRDPRAAARMHAREDELLDALPAKGRRP